MQEGKVVAVADLQVGVDLTVEKTPVLAVKAKKLYRNVRPTSEEKLYFREEGDNLYCFLAEDIAALKKEEFNEETIKVKKGSWGLLNHIESVSSRFNQIGMKLSNDGVLAENNVRYLLKEASFLDLVFENDESGVERIAEDLWVSIMQGDDFLPPTVLITLYRAIKKHNIM